MKRKKRRLKAVTEAPQVRMDAAGIDIGANEIFVAVDTRSPIGFLPAGCER